WRTLGLDVTGGGVVRFDRNYRNTQQIAQLAKAVTDTPQFTEGIELVRAAEPAAVGIKPLLVRAETLENQLAQAAKFANNLAYDRRTRAADQRVAVLMPTDNLSGRLAGKLDRPIRVHLHKSMPRWDRRPGIFYGPYAEARGLEFHSVILPFCDEKGLPRPEAIEAFGLDEAKVRQARELYVAITRARTNLVIIHSSRITGLLPQEDSDLYERA
ncbi:MAG: 3'-5' exonuclease, partial [Acidimicrobiales bacterium]